MGKQVSFIVCTRNRSKALLASLDSIGAAMASSPGVACELIIVDNNSTDETFAVASAWRDDNPAIDATVVREDKAGLSASRNRGISHAAGEILAFTDDDCLLGEGYLPMLVNLHSQRNRPAIIGGRVELGDPNDLPFTIKTDRRGAVLDHSVHPAGFINGCNMTMHRAVSQAVGPFDERFGAGTRLKSAEDTDYLYRAMLRGVAVEYRPELCVYHYHGRRDVESIHRLSYGYEVGNGAFYAKHVVRSPRVLRYFYWDLKNALNEKFGRRRADGLLPSSKKISPNIRGFFGYYLPSLKL